MNVRFCVFLTIFLCVTINAAMGKEMVREPAVAGQFYPGNSKELESLVDVFLNQSARFSEKTPFAFIVPHAGFVFSGIVQAAAYRQLESAKIDTVILIGLAHRYPLTRAAVYPGGSFKTPLGLVSIDEDTAARILKNSELFESNETAHEGEHSLETQLPFLQKTLRNFKIVPIVMGNPDKKTAQRTGEAIAAVIGENESRGIRTLLIGSTDMAHYPDAKTANESDQKILDVMERLDIDELVNTTRNLLSQKVPELHVTLCGEGAALAVMSAVKKFGVNKGITLKHATSADSPFGDSKRTVGYGAVAFYKDSSETSSEALFSELEQKRLLTHARSSIHEYLKTGKSQNAFIESEKFKVPSAVFVTLEMKGALRGCIGTTEPNMPLMEAVGYYAVQAAVKDPRFSPLTLTELDQVNIEISVLSKPGKIGSADAIVPFRDGVILKNGSRGGLFLPQVWSHVAGSKEQFLNLLASEKAGLSATAWKDPQTELYTFTVFSFKE